MSLNFDYLKSASPSLFQSLNGPIIPDSRLTSIEVLQTKQGQPNIKLNHKAGSNFAHSNYAPEKEGIKIYEKMGYQKHRLNIAFGFGLGYHIDITKPQGERITNMTILKTGESIDPSKSYVVAGWASVNEGTEGPPIWDVLERHIRQLGVVSLPENKSVQIKGV